MGERETKKILTEVFKNCQRVGYGDKLVRVFQSITDSVSHCVPFDIDEPSKFHAIVGKVIKAGKLNLNPQTEQVGAVLVTDMETVKLRVIGKNPLDTYYLMPVDQIWNTDDHALLPAELARAITGVWSCHTDRLLSYTPETSHWFYLSVKADKGPLYPTLPEGHKFRKLYDSLHQELESIGAFQRIGPFFPPEIYLKGAGY